MNLRQRRPYCLLFGTRKIFKPQRHLANSIAPAKAFSVLILAADSPAAASVPSRVRAIRSASPPNKDTSRRAQIAAALAIDNARQP